MELSFEGTIKRTWFSGRKHLTLRVQNAAELALEDPAVRPFFVDLYRAFCRRVQDHLLLPGEPLEGADFDLLTVLLHLSREAPESGLKLRNMRGVPSEQAAAGDLRRWDSGEALLVIRGIVEVPAERDTEPDPAESEHGPRQEEFSCEVRTFFEQFAGKGGIVYRMEYRDRFPGELREAKPAIVLHPATKMLLNEFKFSSEFFESSSSGLAYGLTPSVTSRCTWSWNRGKIQLGFYRELRRTESADQLRRFPEIVEFDRALENHGLYTGFTERCVQFFDGDLHHNSARD